MNAAAGDPQSWGPGDAVAELYDRFGPVLYRTARTLLGGTDLAEDAVQETFVGLVRAGVSPDKMKDVRAYLFAALRNAASRLRAQIARDRPVPPEEFNALATSAPQSADLDRSVRLEQALRDLPPDQREVIALKIDGGLTFAEVADCLGVSANTAASRYRYALEKLRAALGEGEHDG
jgi:RNA polymerase sigma-70 factor (ECF subfamily)